jgi:hypothetical protein
LAKFGTSSFQSPYAKYPISASKFALLNCRYLEQSAKLYGDYVLNHDTLPVFRHRGKAPRQAAFL